MARTGWQLEWCRPEGITVAAAVHAKATLGDPYADPYPAQSVLLVDDQANPQQQAALAAFARHMGGKLLDNADQVLPVQMELVVNHERHGVAMLRAGRFATVQTRSLNDTDHLCGNEETFYPPLTQLAHSMPAVALTDKYRGPGLGVDWESHGKRSAFVGTFTQLRTGTQSKMATSLAARLFCSLTLLAYFTIAPLKMARLKLERRFLMPAFLTP